LSNTFGSGLLYNKSKTEQLMAGKNQYWYSFKNQLLEHFGCITTKGEGNVHFKAKQFELKDKKQKQSQLQIS